MMEMLKRMLKKKKMFDSPSPVCTVENTKKEEEKKGKHKAGRPVDPSRSGA